MSNLARWFVARNASRLSSFPKDPRTQHKFGVNMKFFFQLVSVPTVDTSGTLLFVHFDDKRYVFGQVGEGTQRSFVERGISIAKVNHMFLSGRMTWQQNGGLLGLLLTLAETTKVTNVSATESKQAKLDKSKQRLAVLQGSDNAKHVKLRADLIKAIERLERVEIEETPGLRICGPPNLTHMLATSRRFIFRQGMPMFIKEFDQSSTPSTPQNSPIEPTWTDSHLKVWVLPVSPGSDESDKCSRKRSRDDFEEQNDPNVSDNSPTPSEKNLEDQIARQSIVSEMFNSSWKMDSLVEVPLREAPAQAALFVRNKESHKLEKITKPTTGEIPDIDVLVRKPWPGAMVETLPPTKPSPTSVSYIIQHQNMRGKFDVKKAKELGVEPGPKYSLLTKGESVQTQDGKTITPDMVLGETQTGKALAFIDLPTAEYVDSFINRPEWTCNPDLLEALQCIIWTLGPGVGADPKLQQFMTSMPKVKHIVSSTDYCPNSVAFQSSAVATTKFSLVDGFRYRPPVVDSTTIPQKIINNPNTAAVQSEITKLDIMEPAEAGLIIQMQPKFSLDRSEIRKPWDPSSVPPDPTLPPVSISQFQERIDAVRSLNHPGQDAEVITLGTGSSLPSKYRNVSATLIRVPGVGNYLLDCGENTIGQIRRMYGPDEAADVIRNLRMIWVSHLHADHHLGTVAVIKAWNELVYGSDRQIEKPRQDLENILQEKRLVVVSGLRMIDFLREYASAESFGFDKIIPLAAVGNGERNPAFQFQHLNEDYSLVTETDEQPGPSSHVTSLSFNTQSDTDSNPHLTPLLQSSTGLSDLSTCYVSHCHDARAVALTFPDGFKVSYSGDCRPSESFARIGLDSTVMIHEATFEDDMKVDALAKKHSTVSEALQVGKSMRARNIVLTHFSQRYQSVPVCGTAGDDEFHLTPVIVAFDMMRLRVGDAAAAQGYLQTLMKAYVDTEFEDADEIGIEGDPGANNDVDTNVL